jgi:hypothetical protein
MISKKDRTARNDTERELPALSDEQWQRIARLLGTDDPKWRAQIDHILAFRFTLSLRQQQGAARKRDLARIKLASNLAQKLALLLGDIEVEKVDDLSKAANFCVNRLNSDFAEPLCEGKQRGKERFLERDFCISLLVSYVWNKARTGSTLGRVKIGDERGPLVTFLTEAYRPIETLTTSTVREIARLPSRFSARYSQDRWKVGDLDLRNSREMFEEQSNELDEAFAQHARELEELFEGQARELEEMRLRHEHEIEETRRVTQSAPPDDVARELEENRRQLEQEIEERRRVAQLYRRRLSNPAGSSTRGEENSPRSPGCDPRRAVVMPNKV